MDPEEYNGIVASAIEIGFDQDVIQYVTEGAIRFGKHIDIDMLINAILELSEEDQQHIKDGWFCIHSREPTECVRCNKDPLGNPLHNQAKPRSLLGFSKKHQRMPVTQQSSPIVHKHKLQRPHSASPTPAPSTIRITDKKGEPEKALSNDADKCVICFVNDQNSVFVPCGHIATCFECGNEHFKRTHECPICQKKMDMVIKTFKVTL